MCPRTSWSLSSFTRNIVLGRASITSPSISIFSSLLKAGSKLPRGADRGTQTAGKRRGLTSLESRFSGAVLEEAVDRVLEVGGGEQPAGELPDAGVGAVDALVEVGAHHALGGGVSARRARVQAPGELQRLLGELVVRQHPVHHVPELKPGSV